MSTADCRDFGILALATLWIDVCIEEALNLDEQSWHWVLDGKIGSVYGYFPEAILLHHFI